MIESESADNKNTQSCFRFLAIHGLSSLSARLEELHHITAWSGQSLTQTQLAHPPDLPDFSQLTRLRSSPKFQTHSRPAIRPSLLSLYEQRKSTPPSIHRSSDPALNEAPSTLHSSNFHPLKPVIMHRCPPFIPPSNAACNSLATCPFSYDP